MELKKRRGEKKMKGKFKYKNSRNFIANNILQRDAITISLAQAE